MRTTPSRVLAIVVATTAAGVLGACGPAPDTGIDAPAAAQLHPRWASCAEAQPQPSTAPVLRGADGIGLARLPDDFVPVAAVVCAEEHRRRADGGVDLIATERRATDVAALAAALRLPDQPRTADACTLDLPGVPWFAVVDDQGRWLRPGVPADACGKIRIEVRDAVAGLAATQVSARPVGQIESAEAAATGCGQSWADMIAVSAQQGSTARPRAGEPSPLADAREVRFCVYRVPPDQQGTGKPAGEFERGEVLTAQRWAAVRALLSVPEPAGTCRTPANRFAVLRAVDDRGGAVYVELDGCGRMLIERLSGGAVLGRADGRLPAQLSR